jgi:copper oxidase (laccase) domain-containing protein
VLDAAFNRLKGMGAHAEDVVVFIVGSICGNCFVHNEPGAEAYITPFDRYGADVFTNRAEGALDMVKLITKLLVHKGVLPQNIHHDKLCTKEEVGLASKRAGRFETRNTIIAVRH